MRGGGLAEGTSLRRVLRALGLLGLAALVSAALCLELVTVTGPGMVPTLLPGDTVLLRRAWLGTPQIGDIVIFEQDGTRYPRRLVATEGQAVALRGGRVFVDMQVVDQGGEAELEVPMGRCGRRTATLRRERLGGRDAWVQPSGDHPEETVPPGHLWLLGDYRREASDSRHWGPAAEGDVGGVVLATLWSRDPCDGSLREGRTLQPVSLLPPGVW